MVEWSTAAWRRQHLLLNSRKREWYVCMARCCVKGVLVHDILYAIRSQCWPFRAAMQGRRRPQGPGRAARLEHGRLRGAERQREWRSTAGGDQGTPGPTQLHARCRPSHRSFPMTSPGSHNHIQGQQAWLSAFSSQHQIVSAQAKERSIVPHQYHLALVQVTSSLLLFPLPGSSHDSRLPPPRRRRVAQPERLPTLPLPGLA